jgi:hypothetical protein
MQRKRPPSVPQVPPLGTALMRAAAAKRTRPRGAIHHPPKRPGSRDRESEDW